MEGGIVKAATNALLTEAREWVDLHEPGHGFEDATGEVVGVIARLIDALEATCGTEVGGGEAVERAGEASR